MPSVSHFTMSPTAKSAARSTSWTLRARTSAPAHERGARSCEQKMCCTAGGVAILTVVWLCRKVSVLFDFPTHPSNWVVELNPDIHAWLARLPKRTSSQLSLVSFDACTSSTCGFTLPKDVYVLCVVRNSVRHHRRTWSFALGLQC